MLEKLNRKLFQFIPRGRIQSLDILRGLAIIAMTLPHQMYLFKIHQTLFGHQWFIAGAYYTRPLFIAVSGMALVLSEKKIRWPFRIIVHGGVLFCMAWMIDVIGHGSLQIDWDIFQVIGACYCIAGLLDYLNYGPKKLIWLALLLSLWTFWPSMRPDTGLFPIWPNGFYFLGGYFFAKWGLSHYNRAWSASLFLIAGIAYLIYFYVYCERAIALSTNPHGIAASYALIFSVVTLSLFMENRHWFERFLPTLLMRFGQYPLSLYFSQQFVVVFGMKSGLRLVPSGIAYLDWAIQTSLLLSVMCAATFFFDRYPFFSMEFWLRKTESIITKAVANTPFLGIPPASKTT